MFSSNQLLWRTELNHVKTETEPIFFFKNRNRTEHHFDKTEWNRTKVYFPKPIKTKKVIKNSKCVHKFRRKCVPSCVNFQWIPPWHLAKSLPFHPFPNNVGPSTSTMIASFALYNYQTIFVITRTQNRLCFFKTHHFSTCWQCFWMQLWL